MVTLRPDTGVADAVPLAVADPDALTVPVTVPAAAVPACVLGIRIAPVPAGDWLDVALPTTVPGMAVGVAGNAVGASDSGFGGACTSRLYPQAAATLRRMVAKIMTTKFGENGPAVLTGRATG
jgi:hypothetical protein